MLRKYPKPIGLGHTAPETAQNKAPSLRIRHPRTPTEKPEPPPDLAERQREEILVSLPPSESPRFDGFASNHTGLLVDAFEKVVV